MTEISSAAAMMRFASPRERLQDTLETQAANGTVNTGDVQALTAALDDIDAVMSQKRGDVGASARPQRLSPTEITEKINGLIENQVQSGKLTTDQAEELKGVFTEAMPSGRHRGPGGPGGPPPGGPGGPGGTDKSSDSSNTLTDLLADFLKVVQESQSKSKTYAANGSSSHISSAALIVNFES